MTDVDGACIHKVPGGEDEIYNVGVFPLADFPQWIIDYPIWFPGDYLMLLDDLVVDHDIMPAENFPHPWIGWRLGANGKWYDPTYEPPVDPTDPTDPTDPPQE